MAKFGNLMELIKEGKVEEARALIEAQKAKVKYAPDTVSVVKGKPARFTRRGKSVAWRGWKLAAQAESDNVSQSVE